MAGDPGEERRAWKEVIGQAGDRYAESTLDNYLLHGTDDEQRAQGECLAAVREFCTRFSRSLHTGCHAFFFGSVGAGKDHLMIGMIREALHAGCYQVRWADAAEMFGEFKDAIGSRGNIGDLIQEFLKPQLLVISDILPVNEPLREFEAEMLFRIVHGRQRRLKSTWVNANVATRDEASAKIGEKILSRLEQDSLVLRMQWSDYRRKAR